MDEDYAVPMECLRQCAAELGEDGASHRAAVRDLELLAKIRAHPRVIAAVKTLESARDTAQANARFLHRLAAGKRHRSDAELFGEVIALLSPGDANGGGK